MAEVRCRKKRDFTTTSYGTRYPLWDETFDMEVTDPSSLLVVNVWDEGLFNSAHLVGRWRMTMKYLFSNPHFCHHSVDDFDVKFTADGVELSGWFPLLDHKYTNLGWPGEVRLEISWTYDRYR